MFLDLCLPARPIRPGDLRLFRNYLASDFPSSVGVQRLDSLVPARVPPLRAAATGGRSIFCSGAPTSIIAIPRSLSQSHTGIPCFACARSCPPRPSSCVGGLAPSPSRGLDLVHIELKPPARDPSLHCRLHKFSSHAPLGWSTVDRPPLTLPLSPAPRHCR